MKAESGPVVTDTRRVDEIAWRDLLHRGAAGAFAVMVGGAVLGFVSHLFVARLVGKAEYGVYALMLSWISVLAVFAQAGQDTSVVRFVPGYVTQGQWGNVRGLRLGIGALVLGISVAIALAGWAFVFFTSDAHSPSWRATFYIGFAMLPVVTQLQQSSAMHRAFKRPVGSGIYATIMRPVALIALLFLLVLFERHIEAPLAAAASAVAALLALGASAFHLTRAWPRAVRTTQPAYELRRWVAMGAKLSLLSVIIVVGNRLDVLLVGALIGADRVGPYYAAVQLAGFALYGVQAVNVVLAPMIAERYEVGDLADLQLMARRASYIGFTGALCAAVVFTLAGRWILGWFGPGFEVGYVPLLALLCGYVLSAAFGEVGFMLSMTKYQLHASLFVAVGILVNAAATMLLVPRLGLTGAAIGAGLSLVVWRFLALRFVVKYLRVNPCIIGRMPSVRYPS